MIQINRTLLKNLFTNPNPQPNRPEVLQIYLRLFYRMFPGKRDFVEFLQTQSIDKQYEAAEKIIHRLCYTSNFPPSFFAVKDIICVENYQKESVSYRDNYIPRDHFIHLVNLYLLGIYIFFYHTEFYNKITFDNRFERHSNVHYQPKIDCVKDFISEWKYFCIFHDIGYVPEIFGNEKFVSDTVRTYKSLLKRPNDFHSSLAKEQPVKQTAFFGAIEIMSRILVAKFVVEYSTDKILKENKIFRTFKEANLSYFADEVEEHSIDFNKEFATVFNETYRLGKIYSNHCIKPLLPILGSDNIIVFGINTETGELSFISYVKEHTRKMVCLTKYAQNEEIRRLVQDESLVLFDDFKPSKFELEYILNKATFKREFYDLVSFDESNVENSYAMMKEKLGIQFVGISCEEQFQDFFFDTYLSLYSTLQEYILPDQTKKNSRIVNEFRKYLDDWEFKFENSEQEIIEINHLMDLIYLLLQGSHVDKIQKSCINHIQKITMLDEMVNKENTTDSKKIIENTVNNYFKMIQKNIESEAVQNTIVSFIKDEYGRYIEQSVALVKVYSILYAGLKSILEKNTCSFAYSFQYDKCKEEFEESFTEGLLQAKTKAILNCSFQDLMKEYHIPYNNKINHGFASMKYASGIFELLRNSIKEESGRSSLKRWKMIEILFSISDSDRNSDYIHQYIENYNHIFRNVLYAILIHDIYPAHFSDSHSLYKMQTTISDPFSYFALLCDSLQHWNRPQSISASLLDIKTNEHASEEYNIVVKNDGIYLYELDDEKSQKRIVLNIEGMTHLADIKAFLKNGYVNKPEIRE